MCTPGCATGGKWFEWSERLSRHFGFWEKVAGMVGEVTESFGRHFGGDVKRKMVSVQITKLVIRLVKINV